MVGLYKDPKGETITTLGTIGLKDKVVSDDNELTDELQMLRQKVMTLENDLKKNVPACGNVVDCIVPGKRKVEQTKKENTL
ncbi:hypothetical protein GBAR_LOCUS252 [Geodia barretti]|uniref:Uncharacterized protein n=1 Tax=Geodia barretti TaxID=519541 RepID=A0AA35QRV8_GEOBA|nr:hypothetical protein GBAR_LOCUS252 [Geodia barretti]